jgi:type II secretory pathway pseudopilin PulG
MLVIAISALFLRIAVERIIKYNIAQNESIAQGTVKLISAALENYAKDNHGIYPTSLAVLTKTKLAYLDRDYTNSPFKGYNYSCSRIEASGYSCNASPTRCKLTGSMIYNVTTGSLLVSEECEKKE